MIGAVVPQSVRGAWLLLDFDVQCTLDGCSREWLEFAVLVVVRILLVQLFRVS